MKSDRNAVVVSRRTTLKAVAAAGLGIVWPRAGQGAGADRRAAALGYLESLARPDGGYAWEDQESSHLTPTFAVIGCYHLLKQAPPNKARLAHFVRTRPPSQPKRLEQEHRIFDYQQVQALVWLEEDATDFRDRIRAYTRPLAYMKQYEQHGYPVFQSEASVMVSRGLLGLAADEVSPQFTKYLNARRRANGSFNNTPASDGGDGHVLNTWWGLQALHCLGRAEEHRDETIAWLQGCQLPSGGFTYQPHPEFGGVDDAAYTWAAVRALKMLGVAPAKPEACVAWLRSLANADGGFSDRPGWLSNPMATYYVLSALNALGALETIKPTPGRSSRPRNVLPPGLKVFTIQLEAHGHGSPAEAVDLARGLRIHLWGAKNARPEWIKRARAIADRQQGPVTFFTADEEYGTWIDVPGLGTYSHMTDIIAPAGVNAGSSLADQGVVSWPAFRERRLEPLTQGAGRLFWQFGENEELVRILLDDSLERGGYAAISTYHFGNPDFTNSEPFLHRWRGQIPYVALQDAHGSEPWWFADMTTGFRTVFLATEPTWQGWLNALQRNWVVAIRRDAASGQATWMHSGSREVLEFVRAHEREWRWWDHPEIARPLVSIVPLTPADEFEVGHPSSGLTLRVRCAWENTAQGLLKRPMTELLNLILDGKEVKPEVASVKAPRGGNLADQYHSFHLKDPQPGGHKATAIVRVIDTKAEISRTVEFSV